LGTPTASLERNISWMGTHGKSAQAAGNFYVNVLLSWSSTVSSRFNRQLVNRAEHNEAKLFIDREELATECFATNAVGDLIQIWITGNSFWSL